MGKSKTPTAEPVTAQQTASQTAAAREQTDPRMAQLSYDIFTNPQYGAAPLSQFAQNLYYQLNPQAQALKSGIYGNLIDSLTNPNYITDAEQAAVNRYRDQAAKRQQDTLNTQANLGGGLYGGRNMLNNILAANQLADTFSMQDIGLRQQNLGNVRNAILALMAQNPEPGVVTPQYESAAPSGNAVYQGQINQNQFAANMAAQQQASRNALLGSLFGGLGSAAGMALSGPLGSSLSKIGSGNVPGTGIFGTTLGGKTQSEILGIPTAAYR